MAEAAQNPQLSEALRQHLGETDNQLRRLEQIFQELGQEAKRETCQAMKGLIEEAEEIVSAKGDPDVKDAGLIAAAQRIEHYEMAGYGTARNFAQRLGRDEAARLLQESLDEEHQADAELTRIAVELVNAQAQEA